MALSHLGQGKTIADVDTAASSNPHAAACVDLYDTTLKEVLREFDWPFASKSAVLFWQHNNPTLEWSVAYMYPSDCLMARRIQSDYRVDNRYSRVPFRRVYATAPADADGIALSQTPSGSGNLTLNGVYSGTVTSGQYVASEGRLITITAAANESARTFTVTGTDRDDAALVWSPAGPNATTTTSTSYFKTITTIAIDGAASGAITVGVAAGSYGDEIWTDAAVETSSTTQLSTAPVLEYTVDLSGSPQRFDDDFAKAFTYRLAAEIAPRVTGGEKFDGRSLQMYRLMLAHARQNAARERGFDIEPTTDSILARQ